MNIDLDQYTLIQCKYCTCSLRKHEITEKRISEEIGIYKVDFSYFYCKNEIECKTRKKVINYPLSIFDKTSRKIELFRLHDKINYLIDQNI